MDLTSFVIGAVFGAAFGIIFGTLIAIALIFRVVCFMDSGK